MWLFIPSGSKPTVNKLKPGSIPSQFPYRPTTSTPESQARDASATRRNLLPQINALIIDRKMMVIEEENLPLEQEVEVPATDID